MAKPGWYPDPAGGPGLRWWDGSAWATNGPPSTQPPNRRGPLLALVALLLALALLVWFLVRRDMAPGAVEDDNSSTPTISAWDERSSSPQPSATEEPTDAGGRPVACPEVEVTRASGQPSNGRYAGGGLSFAEVPGWQDSRGWGVDWATDIAGQRNSVVDNWVAMVMVGEIDKQHFPNPRAATSMLASCEATSYYYPNLTGRRDIVNKAVTIEGRPGWHLATELTVEHPHVAGDQVDVVVVDVGREGRLAVFVGEAPLGDQRRIDLVRAARESLRVEG